MESTLREFATHSMTILSLPRIFILVILVLASVSEIRRNKIPNMLTLSAAVAGLMWGTISGGLSGFLMAVLGWCAGVAMVLCPFRRRISKAESKLMGAVGACLGPSLVITAFVCQTVIYCLLGIGCFLRSVPYTRLFGQSDLSHGKTVAFFSLTESDARKIIDSVKHYGIQPSSPLLVVGTLMAFYTEEALLGLAGFHL